jgi:myosin heavy subunit
LPSVPTFSQKPPGIFAILDDVCNFPKGTDEKFLGKLNEAFSSHSNYQICDPLHFGIKHYAGPPTCHSHF